MKPYYEHAGVTIYHGDCRDVLPTIPACSVDVVLTDPPYGMAWSGNNSNAQKHNIAGDGLRSGVRLVRTMFHEAREAISDNAHVYLFCHWQSWPDFYDAISTRFRPRNALVWWKETGSLGNFDAEWVRDYEVVLFGNNGGAALSRPGSDGSVLRFRPVPSPSRLHPTEKPIELLAFILGKSELPGTILDPFMGSGTTLVAAKRLGRKAIGIEIEERYCEIAAKRLAQEVMPL